MAASKMPNKTAPGPGRPSKRLKPEVYGLIFMAVLGIFLYSGTLAGPFILDDFHNILENPNVRLDRMSVDGLIRAASKAPMPSRPVSYVTFALNYYFHRYHTVGFRLVNVLIHLLTAFLLYSFIKVTLNLPATAGRYPGAEYLPLCAALLWLVHPLDTQSVAYIVQRMNCLAALFYLGSLLMYVKARLARDPGPKFFSYAAMTVLGLLALGTKEISVTLPFFIFLYEWLFFQEADRHWLKGKILYPAAAILAVFLIGWLYVGGNPVDKLLATYAQRDFTPYERVLTEFRVVIYYLSLILLPLPSRLNIDHDWPLSHSLLDPASTLPALAGILIMLAAAWRLSAKDPLGAFGLLWFLGNLVLESSFIGLEIIFEHRTYLPSMMIILWLVSLAFRILPRRAALAAVLAAAALCSLGTWERNKVWADETALWQDAVIKSPRSARAHNNLGLALARRGLFPEAEAQYRATLEIDPDHAEAHNNLGLALAAQGRSEEAVEQFEKALAIKPEFVAALSNWGRELRRQGRAEEAINLYKKALAIDPESADAYNNLGVALATLGRYEDAAGNFEEALRLDPGQPEAGRNLARARELMAGPKERTQP